MPSRALNKRDLEQFAEKLWHRDLEKFAERLWHDYEFTCRHVTHITWTALKPEVQKEFRRYALAILARTGRQEVQL